MKQTSGLIFLIALATMLSCQKTAEQKSSLPSPQVILSLDSIKTEDVTFESEGVILAGTIYSPSHPQSAVVIVHGSDQVPRMAKFAKQLAQENILAFTYDKRGVGESGGVYAGPEVGTNNISVENLNLLAKDASAAIDAIHERNIDIPLGLIGASQAGWIIPKVANSNPRVQFMVLMSSPTITTLEQLRFQFYTNGDTNFWEKHTEAEAREHVFNDLDKYDFVDTDPKDVLKELSLPGLWIFGEKDIQIPVRLCIEYLDEYKANGKPFEYELFPLLGHNTNKAEPINISVNWIKQKSLVISSKTNKQY